MGLELRAGELHLVCDTCGKGRRRGTGKRGDPYVYRDEPETLQRMWFAGHSLWVCEECFWELSRKELRWNR